MVVEYDGTGYAGFQLQSGQPTIQGEIETAINRFTGERTRIRGASRTDSGAHARGQVVDFTTRAPYPTERFPHALNYYLPADIKVQEAYQVDPGFHSRRDATSRTYDYRIINRPWPSPIHRFDHHWERNPLDIDRMNEAAQALVGVHDFRPLSTGFPQDRSAVREVFRWGVTAEGDAVVVECEATGFLRHMIRRANAILVEVGKGRWPETAAEEVLDGSERVPRQPLSLPARGLCLMNVKYPNNWNKGKNTDETD